MTTSPSERARGLVRGGYDMHVHIDPTSSSGSSTTSPRPALPGAGHRRAFSSSRTTRSTAERAPVVRAAVAGRAGARRDRAQPGGRRASTRSRSRSRRARAPAPSGCRRSTPSTRRTRCERRARGLGAGVGEASSCELRERASDPEPVAGRRRDGSPLPAVQEVLGVIAAPSDGAGDRAPLPRDEIFARRRRGAVDAGVRDVVVTHPEFPSQRPAPRRPERARGQGRAARAVLHHAAHGQGHLGARVRGRPRDRSREHRPLDRSRPGLQPAGRGRSGAVGR